MSDPILPTPLQVASAINVEALKLPDGWIMEEVTVAPPPITRPGLATLVFSGRGPDRVLDTWTTKDGYEHETTEPVTWSFRVIVDSIGED